MDLFHSVELKQNEIDTRDCFWWHPSTTKCRDGIVYVLNSGEYFKIGVTDHRNIKSRIVSASKKYSMDFSLLFYLETICRRGLEEFIHREFSTKKVMNAGGKELFCLFNEDLELLSNIKNFASSPVTLVRCLPRAEILRKMAQFTSS